MVAGISWSLSRRATGAGRIFSGMKPKNSKMTRELEKETQRRKRSSLIRC